MYQEERIGYAPEFLERLREKRRETTLAQIVSYAEKVAILRREAEQARANALSRKAERDRRERAEQIAKLSRAPTRFQLIMVRAMLVFRVSKAEILGNGRGQTVVLARQFVMYWARRRLGLSYPQIGRQLGGRDHTTVLHGVTAYAAKRAVVGRKLRRPR